MGSWEGEEGRFEATRDFTETVWGHVLGQVGHAWTTSQEGWPESEKDLSAGRPICSTAFLQEPGGLSKSQSGLLGCPGATGPETGPLGAQPTRLSPGMTLAPSVPPEGSSHR